MYLGIEIGGTKLQLGVGPDDGKLRGLWRGAVDVAAGPEGIRRQIVVAVPELLTKAGVVQGSAAAYGTGPSMLSSVTGDSCCLISRSESRGSTTRNRDDSVSADSSGGRGRNLCGTFQLRPRTGKSGCRIP